MELPTLTRCLAAWLKRYWTSVAFLSALAWQRRPSTTSVNHFRTHSVPVQFSRRTHISYARRLQQDMIWIQNYKMLSNSIPCIYCIKITFPAAREPNHPLKFSRLPAKLSDFSEVIKVRRPASHGTQLTQNRFNDWFHVKHSLCSISVTSHKTGIQFPEFMPPLQLPPVSEEPQRHNNQGNLSQATSRILWTTITLGSAFSEISHGSHSWFIIENICTVTMPRC